MTPRIFTWLILFLVSFCCLGISSGCGRKGSPRPPEATAPSPVKYLMVKGTVDAIVLTWQAPAKDASGDELLDLVEFIVYRNIYTKDERADFNELSRIAVEQSSDEPMESDGIGLPRDDREVVVYTYRDTDVEPGVQYEYKVLPVNEDGVPGRPTVVLRVRFVGESSVIESLPPQQR